MSQYRLYGSASEWNVKNDALETHLGIPDGKGTLRYAEILEVGNDENSDYGNFIMPVMMDGQWKCDDQFDASNLVNFHPTWNIPPPLT